MTAGAQHVPQPDHCEEHQIYEEQGREHRRTVDEILEQAGRQAVDVRDEVEIETDEPDHNLQRQYRYRDPKKTPVLFDERYSKERSARTTRPAASTTSESNWRRVRQVKRARRSRFE